MELGVQCQRNGSTWRDEATLALSIFSPPVHEAVEFIRRLNTAKMSTNVDAGKILAFDRAASLLHARRLAVLEGQKTPHHAGALTSLRKWHQRSWSPARSAFESLWRHGRRIIYGAVNIGGFGTGGSFGPFCLVIDDPTRPGTRRAPNRPARVAVFPSDTAQTYVAADGTVNAQAAGNDAACWSNRGDVAIWKHAADLGTVAAGEWDQLVCSADRYIEVCVADPIAVTDIDSVRIPRELLRLRTAAFAQPDPLDPVAERLAEAVAIVERWGALGVTVEVAR